jgi:uncharacterized RDD family membrane protein YckC
MASAPETVVTGDAVVLDVQIAQLPVRALAALIDLIVIGAAYLTALLLWTAALPRFDEAFTSAIMIVFTVAVIVGYPLAMEMATRGRSLGKIVMGLRVVADDGGPERFRQALFRALAAVVEIWMLLGSPAVICSLLSARGKRIGDIFAGTVVISERGPKSPGPPVMPPQAELARQFLARESELTQTIRDEMGYRVAAEVVSRISPPPPVGAPPRQVLAAVLAERHRRELLRLQPSQPAPPTYPPVSPPPATGGSVPNTPGGLVPPG